MAESRRRRRTDRLFGHIAVELGIVTPEQLEEALQVQAAVSSRPPPLGVVLMELRLVTPEDLERIVETQRKIVEEIRGREKEQKDDNLFGKVAVRLGFVTQEQLYKCLELQRLEGPI